MSNKYQNNTEMIIYSDLINDCEIIIEVLNCSTSINKDYSRLKSKYYFTVDILCPHCNDYVYQKNFTKFRHAKKAFKKLTKSYREKK